MNEDKTKKETTSSKETNNIEKASGKEKLSETKSSELIGTKSNANDEKNLKNESQKLPPDSNKTLSSESKSSPESKNNEESKPKNENESKLNKTLTSTPLKQKKVNDSENKQNDSKSNNNDSFSKNTDQGELVEKLVSINRVAKVVKGGRRFSFAALVVVGDGNGLVGHGKGKAKEVPEAIKKATDEAKSKMIRVPLRQGRTLHHDIKGRFDSGKVYLRSAPSGTGVIAGGPMRAVFEALGIQDIVAKSVGTSNPHNMVRATFEALKSASSPKIIAVRRNLKINDITKRRKNSQNSGENVKN
tara:strand:+ start:589 stop:1494 length:906 start_codon:yes stop_codon:yes gene_type:complete